MKIKLFTIPVHAESAQQDELNRFLSNHRIVSVAKHFVDAGMDSAWSFCITWTEATDKLPNQKGRIDYKKILSEKEFTVYAALRELRKALSERDGVPAYALFTNEQLAEIVRIGAKSINELTGIRGVGVARAQKYGQVFLDRLSEEQQKLSAQNKKAGEHEAQQTQS